MTSAVTYGSIRNKVFLNRCLFNPYIMIMMRSQKSVGIILYVTRIIFQLCGSRVLILGYTRTRAVPVRVALGVKSCQPDLRWLYMIREMLGDKNVIICII